MCFLRGESAKSFTDGPFCVAGAFVVFFKLVSGRRIAALPPPALFVRRGQHCLPSSASDRLCEGMFALQCDHLSTYTFYRALRPPAHHASHTPSTTGPNASLSMPHLPTVLLPSPGPIHLDSPRVPTSCPTIHPLPRSVSYSFGLDSPCGIDHKYSLISMEQQPKHISKLIGQTCELSI